MQLSAGRQFGFGVELVEVEEEDVLVFEEWLEIGVDDDDEDNEDAATFKSWSREGDTLKVGESHSGEQSARLTPGESGHELVSLTRLGVLGLCLWSTLIRFTSGWFAQVSMSTAAFFPGWLASLAWLALDSACCWISSVHKDAGGLPLQVVHPHRIAFR